MSVTLDMIRPEFRTGVVVCDQLRNTFVVGKGEHTNGCAWVIGREGVSAQRHPTECVLVLSESTSILAIQREINSRPKIGPGRLVLPEGFYSKPDFIAAEPRLADSLASVLTQPVIENGCTKHEDCAAADMLAKQEGRKRPHHCHDEGCEDCFGS